MSNSRPGERQRFEQLTVRATLRTRHPTLVRPSVRKCCSDRLYTKSQCRVLNEASPDSNPTGQWSSETPLYEFGPAHFRTRPPASDRVRQQPVTPSPFVPPPSADVRPFPPHRSTTGLHSGPLGQCASTTGGNGLSQFGQPKRPVRQH